ncbi:MAG: hypothetical protein R2764_26010 [Bacteroidales bacterium]
MEQIHIGKLIEEQVPPLMTKAKLSRLLGVSQPAATQMLKVKTMQVKKLLLVSERLNYNFFRAIGELLPIEEPSGIPEDVYYSQLLGQLKANN